MGFLPLQAFAHMYMYKISDIFAIIFYICINMYAETNVCIFYAICLLSKNLSCLHLSFDKRVLREKYSIAAKLIK